MYAPIVIFAFNRLEPLKRCVVSLLENYEAAESDLFVFVDGPRANKIEETGKVKAVKEYVKTITGFKSLTTSFSDINKGLAESIISGASEVMNRYGRAIILEDDLIVAPGFLSFVNTMLELYQDDKRVMQITGYSAKIRNYKKYNCDYYLSGRAHSWSWATWKDRWDSVDWEVKDYKELLEDKDKQKAFNKFGSDLMGMLKGWHDGLNHSWYIRFNYSMHNQKKYCIAPIRSLIKNDGFGEGATHTSVYNRYKIDFNTKQVNGWKIPDALIFNECLALEAVRYWSIPYRIYGKIMTYITTYWR